MYLRAVKPFYIKEICHIYRYSGTVFGQNQRPTFSTMLSLDTRASAIAKLTSSGGPFTWEEDPSGRNAITKTYQFTDFGQAWEWMKKVAVLAEEINHHPEWKNIYNIVEVTLSTHDCGGVSELDIKMAEMMDSYAADFLPIREQDPK